MEQKTPEILADNARKRGTPIITGEPCQKCREPNAIYYYVRPTVKGQRANGCLWCHYVENRLNATDNQELLTPATMVDDNGTPIYEGRACGKCGSNIRIVGTAYGSKNKGACLSCTLEQQREREHGKQIKRVNRAVTEKVHKFVVSSIERSQSVEVAPRNLQEFFELRELAYRCEAMNQRERALNTGVRWEIGHMYPAAGGGNGDKLRGKATIENLYLVQSTVNRTDGSSRPEHWKPEQVISIADCRAIQRSYEAAKAWKERKVWEQKLSPAEKKERTIAERKANDEHAERVRKIAGDAVRVLEFFQDDLFSFEWMRREIEAKWDRVVVKMSRQIDAYLQSGHALPYTEAREQRLTLEAFCGGHSRLHIIVMTFQQIADAEKILTEQGMTPEQEADLVRLKRYAVMWAQDILSNPRTLVMGFTHPLLNVLGDALSWGTVEDEQGNQWIEVWKNNTLSLDAVTPFDGTPINTDSVNPALLHNQELLTPEPVFSFAGGWKDTAQDYLYEQASKRKAREEREQRQREHEAAQERQRAEEAAILTRTIATEKKAAVDGFEALYWYAEAEWEGQNLAYAESLISEALEKARGHQQQIADCQTLAELNSVLVSINYEQRQLREPEVIFSDLLTPF